MPDTRPTPRLSAAQRRELEQFAPEAEQARRARRAQLLHELREQGWTVRQLAIRLGVHHSQVVGWMAYEPPEKSTGAGHNS